MKRFLTFLFVLAVNFYFACFGLGIAAGFYTRDYGPLPAAGALLLPVIALVLCLAYQLWRRLFSFCSPGELAIGNCQKTDLLVQDKVFSITRIPLFGLLLLTLALAGNFLDSLSQGQVYTLLHLLVLGLLYSCFYLGLRRFFSSPSFLAAGLFAVGLLLAAALAYLSGPAGATVSAMFAGLAGLWVIAWLVYRRFRQPTFIPA